MNLENLISKYKNKKLGNPDSAVSVASIPSNLLENLKNEVTSSYDLTDEQYITKEHVFYNTRRIVAKSPYNKESKQFYSDIDFDNKLVDISKLIFPEINKLLPSSVPVLIQLATILPEQSLSWHIDVFLYQQFTNKLHIPITTNAECFFDTFVNDDHVKRIHMETGLIYNIDNLSLHRSINKGNTPRTHLIIDFMDTEILDFLIESDINFFHTKLQHMSEIEKVSLNKLALKYKVT